MTRNKNPFTTRQAKVLETIHHKIMEINDPDKDYITHESYKFYIAQTNQFGKIPKIQFEPNSTYIKADIMRSAGLANKARFKKINQIRADIGITKKRDTESRTLARLFESEWNNIMHKLKKAVFTAVFVNNLFIRDHQQVSDTMDFLQQFVMEEYAGHIKVKKD